MRWRILCLLVIARLGLGFHFQTLISVSTDVATDFSLNFAEVGFFIGLFMAPGIVLSLPSGYLARVAQDQWIIVAGLILLCLGGLLSASAAAPWTIGAGRAVAGTGFLISNIYLTKMVAEWFDGREIATAMSAVTASWPMGIAIGQVGHVWLAAQYGWPAAFYGASIFCGALALAFALFYRAPPDAAGLANALNSRLLPREWVLIAAAGMAWATFNAAYVVYLTYGPLVLEAAGATPLNAAGVISLASWIMMVAALVVGQIADRFGHRAALLTLTMIAGVLSLVGLAHGASPLMMSILMGAFGIAPAGVIIALAGEAVAPERRALGMGAFFTLYYIVMMSAPVATGALYDVWGSLSLVLYSGAGMFVAVLGFYAWFAAVRARHA